MKSIEEAIEHCYTVAENSKCDECKQDHIQLAKWLIELKELREKLEIKYE